MGGCGLGGRCEGDIFGSVLGIEECNGFDGLDTGKLGMDDRIWDEPFFRLSGCRSCLSIGQKYIRVSRSLRGS